MNLPAVFCLAGSRGRADRIINDLKGAEFSNTDVGILFADGNLPIASAPAPDLRAPVDPAAGSAGPIRGVLAWVAGVSRIMVPDIGAFIAAGPVIAALHQVRAGATDVPIARGLVLLGLPAATAARYEERIIANGHILISVHTANSYKIARASEIFAASHALEVFVSDVAVAARAAAVPFPVPTT